MALSLLILPTLTFSLSDLERYFQGLGPPPKFQVTLNFLEEDPDPSHIPQSLISVQVSPGQGENSCLCRRGGPGEGPWSGQGWGLPAVLMMPSSHLFWRRWSRPLLGIYWQSVQRTRQPLCPWCRAWKTYLPPLCSILPIFSERDSFSTLWTCLPW